MGIEWRVSDVIWNDKVVQEKKLRTRSKKEGQKGDKRKEQKRRVFRNKQERKDKELPVY